MTLFCKKLFRDFFNRIKAICRSFISTVRIFLPSSVSSYAQRKENVIRVRASKLCSSSYLPAPPCQPESVFLNRPFANQPRSTIAVDSGRVSKLFPDNSTARWEVILSSLIRHVNEGLQTNQDLRRRHNHPTTAKGKKLQHIKSFL
jgi:hypothetical protein